MTGNLTGRVLLLMKASTYRAPDFLAAAKRLGIEVVRVIDTPGPLAGTRSDVLYLDFRDLDAAVSYLLGYAKNRAVAAVLPVDDSGALLAAHTAAALDLPHNDSLAAEAARDKHRMRQLFAARGVPGPTFRRFTTADDPDSVATAVSYPAVVKPLRRSGSQGVIRANSPAELTAALARLRPILATDGAPGPHPFLVEDYLPGVEVALEGLIAGDQLHVLALFDKPDPLKGPFFEETIYVTPSRLPAATQEAIAAATEAAAAALGLRRGPIHAELRVGEDGQPWLLEIAGRSIGGLCARTLRFGVDVSLEELILRQAVGLPLPVQRESSARGVIMIPIPAAGLLRGYRGVAEAEAVPGIESVEITAPLNNLLTPLPEGDSYLGFIFARGEEPAVVEAALRQAHACLHFDVEPVIPLSLRA
ncbi:MAG: ATP-grasp domain-containing protein [Anaerolineae bacterium]|nr:ATP-grasp domain-containing protein [Anaerolineae bacterium]